MLSEQTIEKLYAMKLNGLAEAFKDQLLQPDLSDLSFEERFSLLVRIVDRFGLFHCPLELEEDEPAVTDLDAARQPARRVGSRLLSERAEQRYKAVTGESAQRDFVDEAMRQATALRQAGMLGEAEGVYRSILAVEHSHHGARRGLGLLAVETGRPREALLLLKAALDADPADREALTGYAIALAGTGQQLLARSVLDEARLGGGDVAALDDAMARVERINAAKAAGSGPGHPPRP